MRSIFQLYNSPLGLERSSTQEDYKTLGEDNQTPNGTICSFIVLVNATKESELTILEKIQSIKRYQICLLYVRTKSCTFIKCY